MRRKLLVALILAILVVSVFLYVFFEVPLIRGVKYKSLSGSGGFGYSVTYYDPVDPGISFWRVFKQGEKINISEWTWHDGGQVQVPAQTGKVLTKEDVERFKDFLEKDMKVVVTEFHVVLIAENIWIRVGYESSLSYHFFGVGYYREWEESFIGQGPFPPV